MPLLRLGPCGGLLGVSDGVFLKVGALEPLGNLAATICDALRFGRIGFNGPDPLKVAKESLHLGTVAKPILKRHFHRRLAVAALGIVTVRGAAFYQVHPVVAGRLPTNLAGMKTAEAVKPRSRPRARRIPGTGGRFRISDELWALMEPLLPKHQNTHRFGGGRPRVPDRQCADAIFFVLRTGCQWNALFATGLCPSSTAHDRFQAWVQDGNF